MKQKITDILSWSEQYTKTDMNYVVKGSFWLNMSQVVAMGASFALSVTFAHFVSQENMGTYRYILSLAGIVGALSLSGLGTALTRAIAQGYEGDFIKSFWLNMRWGLSLSIISVCISIYYFVNENYVLAIGILIAGFCSPLFDSLELYGVFQNGKKDFRSFGLYRITRSLITTVLFIPIIYITQNPVILVMSYFVIHILTLSFIFIKTYKKYRPNSKINPETLHLGKHLSVMNSFASFADKIDQVLVFHYMGPIQLAIYNYATIIPNSIGSFTKNIGSLATPKYAVADKFAARSTIFRKSSLIFLYSIIVCIAYVFFAQFIFKTFFPQYIDSIVYSQIYAITLLINGSLPIAFLDAHKAIKEKYQLTAISNVFKIIAVSIGLIFFGLVGLIVARIISKLFGLILSWFLIYKV